MRTLGDILAQYRHRCLIPGCGHISAKNGYVCAEHWFIVPRSRRILVTKAQNLGAYAIAVYHALSSIPEWGEG